MTFEEKKARAIFVKGWQTKLAGALDVTPRTIRNWKKNGWPVVASLAIETLFEREFKNGFSE